jgi:hypothetical protein
MNKGRVGEERKGKETDGYFLTLARVPQCKGNLTYLRRAIALKPSQGKSKVNI